MTLRSATEARVSILERHLRDKQLSAQELATRMRLTWIQVWHLLKTNKQFKQVAKRPVTKGRAPILWTVK
jgi:hypothetical protein